jgi:AraC-like DNA-binding protein
MERAMNNEPVAMNITYLWSTPEIRGILHSILFCTFTEPMKRFYLEAKVHELMLLAFLNATPEESYKPNLTLKDSDLDKLQQAREFLTLNLDNPGSLLELAHNIGLNDFKLKQGFKQLYGTTVFGFLHEERMQKANVLLRDTSMSIHEISMIAGYKNLSNFTAAFKKRFGFPPSAIGNRR